MPPLRIVVHGGAWSIPDSLREANQRACRHAAEVGYALLQKGASALDAVEAAVRSMEDDPHLDAGYGSWLNEDGDAELDAMIMDGATTKAGAVASVRTRHPVSLARKVMEKTEHVMLAGEGAERFARELGLRAGTEARPDLVTAEAEEELRKYRTYAPAVRDLFRKGCDTVGAVAMDAAGHLAAATSTGGVTAKRRGRVGDSPIVGSGAFADDGCGAASATGHGEAIMRVVLCRHAVWLAESGQHPQQAAAGALRRMHERCACPDKGGATGGLILITPSGEVGVACTTARMVWAAVEGQGPGSEPQRRGGFEASEATWQPRAAAPARL
eukprot:TRINITY_DN66297_c0_g1_i1.p1 TRINITY_DN66297_c0_g1~~TRINITY_DN66297_c0_g1_i1.p1  ORF type:complete len:359 (+),score=120.29 TRINITY_DN66297_c0_g1_i1:94-1077(+)